MFSHGHDIKPNHEHDAKFSYGTTQSLVMARRKV